MHYKQLFIKLLIGVLATGLAASCTPLQNMIYLREGEEVPDPPEKEPYRLQAGDMLYINVESANITGETGLFQQQTQSQSRSGTPGGNAIGNPSAYMNSYQLNDSGYVNLPLLGALPMEGLTLPEANERVQQHVNNYVKKGVARVRLASFQLTIFGEINQPGTYQVYMPELNMLQLISSAGGLSPYANRQRIMLIRQRPEKRDTTVYLDLTRRQVMQNPYFYLKPGDQVYVRPHLLSKASGFSAIPWSLIFSSISTTLLIINFIGN